VDEGHFTELLLNYGKDIDILMGATGMSRPSVVQKMFHLKLKLQKKLNDGKEITDKQRKALTILTVDNKRGRK
jgi:hypothetical protein